MWNAYSLLPDTKDTLIPPTLDRQLPATKKTPASSTMKTSEPPSNASTQPEATPSPTMEKFPDLEDTAAELSTKTRSTKSFSTSSTQSIAPDASFTCSTCSTPDIPAASLVYEKCVHKYCYPCLETLLDPYLDLTLTLPICSICNPFLQSLLNSRQEDRDEIERVKFLKEVHEAKAAIAREGYDEFLKGVEARRMELLREMREEVDVVWRGLREVEEAERREREEEAALEMERLGSVEMGAVWLNGDDEDGRDYQEGVESSDEDYLDVRIRELIGDGGDSGSDTDKDEDDAAYAGAIAAIQEHENIIAAYQLENIEEEDEDQSHEDLDATIANLLSAQHLRTPDNTANPRISVATALSIPRSEFSVPESTYNPFEFEYVPLRLATEASLLANINFPLPPNTPTEPYHSANASEPFPQGETTKLTAHDEITHSSQNDHDPALEPFHSGPHELEIKPPRDELPFPPQKSSAENTITPTLRDRRVQKYANAQEQYKSHMTHLSLAENLASLDIPAEKASTISPREHKSFEEKTPTTTGSEYLYMKMAKRPNLERVNTGSDYMQAWRPPVYPDPRRQTGGSRPETPGISGSFI